MSGKQTLSSLIYVKSLNLVNYSSKILSGQYYHYFALLREHWQD